FVSKRKNNLKFSISAVDYLLNNFITYLKKENLFENTAIFIFPDHTLMGNSGTIINKLKTSKRQLYLITNVSEDILPKKTTDTLYQIDLPKMIISGAEIKTNAKFLTDFIPTDNVIDYLKKNRVKLTTLNTASIAKKDYKSGIDISLIDNYLTISSKEDNIKILLNEKFNNLTFDVTFNSEMVLISYAKRSLKNVFTLSKYDKQHNQLHLIVNLKNKKINRVYLGNKQSLGLYKKGVKVSFAKKDIKLITESIDAIIDIPKKQDKVQLDKILKNNIEANLYRKDTKRFIAHAGGQINKHKYINSL
ncbi:hypothetical protein QUF74_03040, partial [Candidatus Halobeggiatoa sp. HSG11]|nr:hypothetical protein [Candidatus Halobeggiatoa sp. HSG11]